MYCLIYTITVNDCFTSSFILLELALCGSELLWINLKKLCRPIGKICATVLAAGQLTSSPICYRSVCRNQLSLFVLTTSEVIAHDFHLNKGGRL